MSLAAMRQRPSRCCTAPRTRLNWSACRRRSIASARCLSIAPPSLSTEATERSRIWRTLSEIMVGLTALMFLFVLGFILKRRVLYPVVRLSDVVQRLASRGLCGGDAALYPVDEIGDMAQAIRIFRENGLGPSAAGAAARRRLGDPRAAGAYDSAAAGL